jgi:RHS repeat-associated protein
MQENGTPLFYTTDHLGSIRELTDGAGAVRARYDYDPYGRTTKISGDKDSVFAFTGHLLHTPSGLALAAYRAYDPGLGRWISADPIGLRGGPNLYSYVGGRPIDASDPLGLQVPDPELVQDVAEAARLGFLLTMGMLAQAMEASKKSRASAPPSIPDAIPKLPPSMQPPRDASDPDPASMPGPEPSPVPVNVPDKKEECKPDKGCRPCIPPVGTIAYRMCTDPKVVHRGVPAPHHHLYVMLQSPPPMCKCFWKKMDDEGGFAAGDPPPGIPEIDPATGGGVE